MKNKSQSIYEIRNRLKLFKRAYENGDIEKSTYELVLKSTAELIPKKVQIRGKNGQVYQATRWVKPNDEVDKIATVRKEIKFSGSFEERIQQIISSNLSKVDKGRELINEGIYDKNILSLYAGGGGSAYLIKEYNLKQYQNTQKDKSSSIKKKIEEEQKHNFTPTQKEKNVFLREQPIEELWEDYEINLEMVANGDEKLAIAYGTGGVGKTYTFQKIAKKLKLRKYDAEIQPSKDQYDYVVIGGKISPGEVYAEMYRHKDKLMVFDDCDSFLLQQDVQGFLKRGLDSGEENEPLSYLTKNPMYKIRGEKESGKIPSTFKFSGRVIAISNLSPDKIEQAILTRAQMSNLTMTVDETLKQLGTFKDDMKIYNADKTDEIKISKEIRDYVFDFISTPKIKNLLGDNIGGRTYGKLLNKVRVMKERGFENDRINRALTTSAQNLSTEYNNKMKELIKESKKI